MQLQQLIYFRAVAEAGSISRAAELINISQPSISVGIKDLEAELGQPLFVRSSKGITLTSFGDVTLKKVEKILHDVDELSGAPSPVIKINMAHPNGALTNMIAAFSKLHPEVTFQLKMTNENNENDYKPDFVLSDAAPTNFIGWYLCVPVSRQHFYAVVPADSAFASRSVIDPAELKDCPFVFATTNDMQNFERVYFMCIESGFAPKLAAATNGQYQKMQLLSSGMFYSIISSNRYEMYKEFSKVAVIPVECIGNDNKLFSLYYQEKTLRNPLIAEFLEFVKAHADI